MLLIGFVIGYASAMVQMALRAREAFREIVLGHPTSEDVFEARVMGSQYLWHFHYPGPDGSFGAVDYGRIDKANPVGIDWSDPAAADDFVTEELVMPLQTSILLLIKSADVIHNVGGLQSYVEQDAIPGKEIPMWLSPEADPRTGVLRCGQFCGAGHDQHHAKFRFVDAEEFELWKAAQPGNE